MNISECGRQLRLASFTPSLRLDGLQTGIDNVRHDVYLSPKFTEVARAHLAKLVAKYGLIEDLVQEAPVAKRPNGAPTGDAGKATGEVADFKSAVTELHVAALNRAKVVGSQAADLLARVAVVKFLRGEAAEQFQIALERSREKLKAMEGPRQSNTTAVIGMRERIGRFLVSKKSVLRRVGQEIYQTLFEVDRQVISRMRRSLFGEVEEPCYGLLLNRLLFTEDGRDDVVNAQYYVMLGSSERDADRFEPVVQVAKTFLVQVGLCDEAADEAALAALLSASENADELVGAGNPDVATDKGKLQQALLDEWTELLEKEGLLDQVVAAYEVPSLLAEYSPPLSPQQLKQALIWREERKRVEKLFEQHGRLSPEDFHAAIRRVAGCRGQKRTSVAGKFLKDVMRYHGDLRRMDAVCAAMDGVNLITSEKLRELSSINRSLYEFLLPEEQKPAEAKVVSHVVLKADIRDSSLLTRTLYERGLNPASYFSLNFYDPINKLLPKYGAKKLFIEGDAVILALFEREGEPGLGVARTCVMAREMIEIVRGYNEKSAATGLPMLELGIGICYQDSAPMYLMDGSDQIMISPALNESDRLSSCTKGARKLLAGIESLFNVYCFQTIDDSDTAGQPEEFLMRYNIGGITINEAAFRKLEKEIKLQTHAAALPSLWEENEIVLYSGLVPLGGGMFHELVVRESRVPHIDARDFHLKQWTGRRYYEVCTNEVIYEYVTSTRAKGKSTGV